MPRRGGRPTNEGRTSLARRCTMPNTCPDCGAPVEFSAATARVLHGDCAGCGHGFTILEGLPPIPASRGESATGESEGAAEAGSVGVTSPEGPECGSCGASLTLRSASATTLEAVCASCNSRFNYTLETAPSEREAPRRFRRPPPESEERGGFARPASRPCRECGGPLQFSTSPDGLVTGECGSCGNRFTLPPRREEGGRGGRPPFRRPGGGGFRPRYGGGGGYSRGGGRGGPPRSGSGSRPYQRRGPPRDDEDDEGSDRRRRRPRRE